MENLKAYVYVIVSGIALLAGAIFVALQWGSWSQFSAFGPEVRARTAYLVLGAAAGGVVAYWMCRLLAAGTRRLWKLRRQQQRIASEVRRAEERKAP